MADLNKIIDELSTLTVVEAAEPKNLEENGEDCSVRVAAPAGAAAPAGEENQNFLSLAAAGDKKLT